MLQSLLVFSYYWKGATTPLALVLADVLVRRCRPTEGYNLLFLPPDTTSHTFSDWILLKHNTIIWRPRFIQFSYWTHQYHWSTKSINTSIINLWINETLKPCQQHSHQNTEQTKKLCNKNHTQLQLQISYFILHMLLWCTKAACICAFTKANPHIYLQF